MLMTGTILNGVAIVAGGVAGLTVTRQMSTATQLKIKVGLGVVSVVVGLKMTWDTLGPGWGGAFKQLVIIVLSLTLGRLLGQLLRIQAGLNRLGQYATSQCSAPQDPKRNRVSEGFLTCTLLYCAGPMAILGSLQDGLEGRWQTLAIKAVMDGVATMAFVGTFGWGAVLSVIPVVAYQGTITLGAKYLAPYLQDPAMLAAFSGTGGMLVFCVALIILEIRRIELGDYLPSLAVAPLLGWLWR